MSVCEAIRAALEPLSGCQLTEQGAEITTHCLYPSFEPVKVYVVGYGAGFIVHDGGGALKSAWDHGREFNAALTAQMNREARRYGLTAADGQIQIQIENPDWLASAILSVANASSAAVQHVAERAAQNAESDLKGRIREMLERVVPSRAIHQDLKVVGNSGRSYAFDFVVDGDKSSVLLLEAVSPFAVSVNSKFVAFSDTRTEALRAASRFAVHDKPLSDTDVSLLQQVADIVPLTSLERGARRALHVN
jgi:hypothetical protein